VPCDITGHRAWHSEAVRAPPFGTPQSAGVPTIGNPVPQGAADSGVVDRRVHPVPVTGVLLDVVKVTPVLLVVPLAPPTPLPPVLVAPPLPVSTTTLPPQAARGGAASERRRARRRERVRKERFMRRA
jgi:hypothetical protein